MDREKLDKANRLNNFINAWSTVIGKYREGLGGHPECLGRALVELDDIDPSLTAPIKAALEKALEAVKREFENM